MAGKIVLVVEDNLGFLAMLCRSLTDADFVAVPATVPEQAKKLLQELKLSRVDLVIANFGVLGTASLIRALRAENEHLKIIAVDDRRATPSVQAEFEAVIQTPSVSGQAPGREWLRIVERFLSAERHSGAG